MDTGERRKVTLPASSRKRARREVEGQYRLPGTETPETWLELQGQLSLFDATIDVEADRKDGHDL